MDVLINAGGKGTRMGACGVEKPMQDIGGMPTVMRVVDAMKRSDYADRILVSVSPNTPVTEKYLNDAGVETIRTSGEDFMMDTRKAFEALGSKFVMTCPSDIPLLTPKIVNECASRFDHNMESMVVMVREDIVREMGMTPSYACDVDGVGYVLSGLSIMHRQLLIDGNYLQETRLLTKFRNLAVNVNTPRELELARRMFTEGGNRSVLLLDGSGFRLLRVGVSAGGFLFALDLHGDDFAHAAGGFALGAGDGPSRGFRRTVGVDAFVLCGALDHGCTAFGTCLPGRLYAAAGPEGIGLRTRRPGTAARETVARPRVHDADGTSLTGGTRAEVVLLGIGWAFGIYAYGLRGHTLTDQAYLGQ